MKIKIILCILSGYMSISNLCAQSLTDKQIREHITNCLDKNYHPDSTGLKGLCRQACVFIKFRINKSGTISGLSFSNDSIGFITSALHLAIDSLQKDQPLMQTLKESGKTVILPFVYDYRIGCKLPVANFATIQGEDTRQYVAKLLKTIMSREHLQDTLLEMLNFNDGKLQVIDCLLLKPYSHWITDWSY